MLFFSSTMHGEICTMSVETYVSNLFPSKYILCDGIKVLVCLWNIVGFFYVNSWVTSPFPGSYTSITFLSLPLSTKIFGLLLSWTATDEVLLNYVPTFRTHGWWARGNFENFIPDRVLYFTLLWKLLKINYLHKFGGLVINGKKT